MITKKQMMPYWGIFFLLLGALWLITICVRVEFYPKKKIRVATSKVVSGSKESSGLKDVVEKTPAPKRFSERQRIFFKILVVVEIAASVLYFFLGFSILRKYPKVNVFALYVVFFDVIYKILFVLCYNGIAVPYQKVFSATNIMSDFFVPKKNIMSELSGFFSGLKMAEAGLSFILLLYIIYYLLVVKFFSSCDEKLF